MSGDIVYKFRSYFWPVVVWPYYEHSHTIQIIGWKNSRPRTLKDVKLSFAGTLTLTNDSLSVRHLLLGRWISMTVRNSDIEEVRTYEKDDELVEVIFKRIEMGSLMNFLLRGAPSNRILLNLRGNQNEFLERIRSMIVREAAQE